MNRQGLQELIAFGIHLSLRNNAGWIRSHPGEELVGDLVAARDALELSGIARRLHYLDERYANGDDDTFPEYHRKVHVALARAHGILKPYGYKAHHQEDPQGASLYAAPLDAQEHDWEHDQEVPY